MTTSCLYDGHILHSRTGPKRNAFRYRLFMWWLDLDELDSVAACVRFFSHNRPGLVTVRSCDHLGDPKRRIKANVQAFLATRGIRLGRGRITMLTNARILGYVFNPVSLYYCYDEADQLDCVVAEVHNTFGERHCYVMRPDPAGSFVQPKEFYVSPFITVDGIYRMTLPVPSDRLRVQMELHQDGRQLFRAVLTGGRLPLTTGNLLRMLLKHPLLTHRVTMLIHRQALRLFRSRVPLVPRPDHTPQEAVS